MKLQSFDRLPTILAALATSLFIVAPVVAAPRIAIQTDAVMYSAGDTIQVSLAADNPGDGMSVDVYVGLLTPDGDLYTYGPSGWTEGIVIWIAEVYVPAGFSMAPRPFFWIDVPSLMPPIAEEGEYSFASVLTRARTYYCVCDLSLAPFEIPHEERRLSAYIDSISPNPAAQDRDVVAFAGHGVSSGGTIEAYEWSSSLDGFLSASDSFTMNANDLAVGTHTISFRVGDERGEWSDFDTASLVILPGNSPPIASITTIVPNPAWQCEHNVTFIGYAEDSDGTVVAYQWSSDIDGLLSTSLEFRMEALDLSLGEHTVSFRVQDDCGAWSLPATRSLTVQPGSRLFVDGATGDDTGRGTESDPFRTITHALSVASGTDKCPVTISVARGTYAGSTNGETFPLVMKSWVSIIGESSKNTILDAHGKAHHVIYCDAVSNLMVEGFTIRGGRTAGATGPDANGAGIFCRSSSLTIRENTITNNAADASMGEGGGIYCLYSSATIVSNLISANTADSPFGRGGGIYCEDSSPTIATNTISDNLVSAVFGFGGGIYCCEDASPLIDSNNITSNLAAYGGGLACYAAQPTIKFNTISSNEATIGAGMYFNEGGSQTIRHNQIVSNTAKVRGGGIACIQSSPTISYNNIVDNFADSGGGVCCGQSSSPVVQGNRLCTNIASADSGYGGGIYCLGADSPRISENIIDNNRAEGDWGKGGGIACVNNSTVTILHNFIIYNLADGPNSEGAAVYVSSTATVTIHNNLIAGNISRYLGGGICCADASALTISNNTLADNWARYGGGIAYPGHAALDVKSALFSSDAVIINCILWGNNDDLLNCSAKYSCISDPDPGAGNIYTDPLFQTGYVDGRGMGDYYLSSTAAGQLYDSDCLDAGSTSAASAALAGRITTIDNALDKGIVDLGFHYRTGLSIR